MISPDRSRRGAERSRLPARRPGIAVLALLGTIPNGELRIVRRPDAAPVANAQVFVADSVSERVLHLESDSQGLVSLALDPPYAVLVEAEGHRSRALWVRDRQALVEILPTAVLRVFARDLRGGPVEGVVLEVRWPRDDELGLEKPPRYRGLGVVPRTPIEREEAEARARENRQVLVDLFEPEAHPAPFAERLERARSLLGPGPIDAQRRTRVRPDWSTQDPRARPGPRSTNAEGVAEWSDLPIGSSYTLELRSDHAVASDGAFTRVGEIGPIDLTLGEVSEFSLSLLDPRLVAGRILGTHGPVDLTIVPVVSKSREIWPRVRSLRTDEQGGFVVLGLESGSHRLQAQWSWNDETQGVEEHFLCVHRFELEGQESEDLGELSPAEGTLELRAVLEDEGGARLDAEDLLPEFARRVRFDLVPLWSDLEFPGPIALPFDRTVLVHGVGDASRALRPVDPALRSVDGRRIQRTAGFLWEKVANQPLEVVHTVLEHRAIEVRIQRPEGRVFPVEVCFGVDRGAPTLQSGSHQFARIEDLVEDRLLLSREETTARCVLDSGTYVVFARSTEPDRAFVALCETLVTEDGTLELKLEECVTVHGSVRGAAQSSPSREISIRLGTGRDRGCTATMDDEGNFVFSGLVPRTRYLWQLGPRSGALRTGEPGSTLEWVVPVGR